MRALSDWFYANKLLLNVQKTNYAVFTPKNTSNNISSITLRNQNQQLVRVNNATFLGIYIDNGLGWDDYINHIVKGYPVDHMKFTISKHIYLSII